MQTFLVSFGTDGDIFPYVGLGRALAARGHEVIFVTSESYRRLAEENGLQFEALVSREKTDALLNNPDFWDPRKSGVLTAKWSRRLIARQYRLISDITAGRDAVMVTSPGVLASRIVQEKHGVPTATLLLQPALIPSCDDPPAMPVGPRLPRSTPGIVANLYWRMIDATAMYFVGLELNRVRKRAGLEPLTSLFDWFLSPELVLGMFPRWFAPPSSDWPPQIQLLGFPMYDGSEQRELSSQCQEFLARGDAPVAFTPGTQMRHGAEFFQAAIETCAALDQRAILITKHREHLPQNLPSTVMHLEFAPFQLLFPSCAAVVHHGGIGTTAKALVAGVPQIVRYMTFDQRDNGVRVRRLGVGKPIRSSRCTAERMIEALQELLRPDVEAQCKLVAQNFGAEDPLELAASLVEKLHRHEFAIADTN